LLVLGAVMPLASALLAVLMICCHLDDSDSECQRNLSSGVARSISVSARGALPGDRNLAFLLRHWLA
jgi:hypothetical protein